MAPVIDEVEPEIILKNHSPIMLLVFIDVDDPKLCLALFLS